MKLESQNLAQAIGARLLARRRTLGILQKHLASLASISVHTLSNIESGKGNPSLDVLERLLQCLGLQCVIQPQTLDDPAIHPHA
jgi:transcriptional regulator with XRE-family HTH domain